MPREYPPRTPSDYEEGLWRAGYESILAIDEVGRGAVAGPLTAAGVIFEPWMLDEPWIDRVRDSKKLSERAREMVADAVRVTKAVTFIASASWRVIDKVGIETAWKIAVEGVIHQAVAAANPDFILMDGPRCPQCEQFDIPWHAAVHGDSLHVSISLASIVAKVARDRQMRKYDKIWPQYRFASNKGYLTDSHQRALEEYGVSSVHRRNWVAVEKAVRGESS